MRVDYDKHTAINCWGTAIEHFKIAFDMRVTSTALKALGKPTPTPIGWGERVAHAILGFIDFIPGIGHLSIAIEKSAWQQPNSMQQTLACVRNLKQALESAPTYLSQVGIFRLSAKENELSSLVDQLKTNPKTPLPDNPILLAAAIKRLLLTAPEPLLTASLSDRLLQATNDEIKGLFQELPSVNKEIVKELLDLFQKIDAQKKHNMMEYRNIAIVFAPSCLLSHITDPLKQLDKTDRATDILVWMMNHKDELFSATAPAVTA